MMKFGLFVFHCVALNLFHLLLLKSFGQLLEAEGHNHNIIIKNCEKYVFLLIEPIVFWFMIFTLLFIHWNHSTLRRWVNFEFSDLLNSVAATNWINVIILIRRLDTDITETNFINLLIFHSTCTIKETTKNASFLYFSIEINIRMMNQEKLHLSPKLGYSAIFALLFGFRFCFGIES